MSYILKKKNYGQDLKGMINIKVGLIDSDKIYSKRFTKLMSERHGSQIEIFSFTDPEKAFGSVEKNGINIVIATKIMSIINSLYLSYTMIFILIYNRNIIVYSYPFFQYYTFQ